ncbi:pyridoxamine 5'-phosphate oxidase family protein [Sinanaerobacter chloroacetimidivorans]|jgi:uncharacterized pyridoxamine 5'-phosphate oxidase family protein|uniref:Pyridoxamine 5'-phosphate oxidase family protein n=1 Tax=Sinanaerobacter chloroacetimidivorans TaxID=2818044 RepID=A0A8J7W1Y4_9FIRM|nr:pyridoxamine 5'-phosphate oxidase family protein [Sinanaerobacter chloroacetimidivorans]MBR0599397.1 pyridoxamine 5'-phosphate oxidase family protein [Sinanaerobacter chloroacetimidivorans]
MDKVLQLLRENMICCLATCSDDKPRASAMEYVIAGDYILFATDGDSIKAANLRANNKISFSAHSMPQFVTIDGTTMEPSEAEINEYNRILFDRHPEFKDMIAKGMMKPFTYFKLVPEVAYYNDYSNGMKPPEIIKM